MCGGVDRKGGLFKDIRWKGRGSLERAFDRAFRVILNQSQLVINKQKRHEKSADVHVCTFFLEDLNIDDFPMLNGNIARNFGASAHEKLLPPSADFDKSFIFFSKIFESYFYSRVSFQKYRYYYQNWPQASLCTLHHPFLFCRYLLYQTIGSVGLQPNRNCTATEVIGIEALW